MAAGAAAIALFATGCGGKSDDHPASSASGGAPALGKLVQSTTFTSINNAPKDSGTFAGFDGTVAHPTTTLPVYATPGGTPVATLPDKELGGPTWVPVVESKPGWDRVLLPSKPNFTAGWIVADKVQKAKSPYEIKVDLSERRLSILKSGRSLGTWSVAIGAPKTPTPTGRTFILALLAPAKPTYSPLILPLGAHSDTLDSYGGGPGTVALHAWTSKDVFGKAVTHGCVRVPDDALKLLAKAPLGSPVTISD